MTARRCCGVHRSIDGNDGHQVVIATRMISSVLGGSHVCASRTNASKQVTASIAEGGRDRVKVPRAALTKAVPRIGIS